MLWHKQFGLAVFVLAGGISATPLWAQKKVDLKNQGRNIDFGDFTNTRPVKTGGSLPTSCSIGELFFLTNTPPGANLYGCTSANTWTSQRGGTGSFNDIGPGLTMASSVLSVDSAVVPGYLTATTIISSWPSVDAQSCQEQTLTLPGATVLDAVIPRWPAVLPDGLIGTMRVTAANNVTVRICNITTASVTIPNNLSYGATIVKPIL